MSTELRVGAPEETILSTQSNLVRTYEELGQYESALSLQRDVYSRRLKLFGEECEETLQAALNYAASLLLGLRFEEAKPFLRKIMPVARRVLGEGNRIMLTMRSLYAEALHRADGATINDLREAVTTIEDTERIARRVLGGAHPLTMTFERDIQRARAVLRARETPPGSQ